MIGPITVYVRCACALLSLYLLYNLQTVQAPTHFPTIPSSINLHRTRQALGFCYWFPKGHECRKVDVKDCCAEIWGPDYRYQNALILKHLQAVGRADPESYDLDKVYLEVVELSFRRSKHKQKLWYMYFRCRDTQSSARLRVAQQVTSRTQVLYTPYYCVQCLPGEEVRSLDAAGSSPLRSLSASARCVPSSENHATIQEPELQTKPSPQVSALERNRKKTHVVEATGIYSPRSIPLGERKRRCVRYEPQEVVPGVTLSAALYDSDRDPQIIDGSLHNSINVDDKVRREDSSAIVNLDGDGNINPIRRHADALLKALHESEREIGDEAIATALDRHEQVDLILNDMNLQITGHYGATIGETAVMNQPGMHLNAIPTIASTSHSIIMAQLDIPDHESVLRDRSGTVDTIRQTSTFQACVYSGNDFDLDLAVAINAFLPMNDGNLWPELEATASAAVELVCMVA